MSENGAKKSLFASVQDFGYAASPESSQIVRQASHITNSSTDKHWLLQERELEHSTWNGIKAHFLYHCSNIYW